MGFMILMYGDFTMGFNVPDIRYVHSFVNRQKHLPDFVYYSRSEVDKPKLVYKNHSFSQRDWGFYDSDGYHEWRSSDE